MAKVLELEFDKKTRINIQPMDILYIKGGKNYKEFVFANGIPSNNLRITTADLLEIFTNCWGDIYNHGLWQLDRSLIINTRYLRCICLKADAGNAENSEEKAKLHKTYTGMVVLNSGHPAAYTIPTITDFPDKKSGDIRLETARHNVEELRDFLYENARELMVTPCEIGKELTIPIENLNVGKRHSFAGKEYVDLGLTSGTLWAACNLYAASPEQFGRYSFADAPETQRGWFEQDFEYFDEEFTKESWSKYVDDCVDWNAHEEYDNDKLRISSGSDIARRAIYAGWRLPTMDEWTELKTECKWEWCRPKNRRFFGALITGPNKNKIFLPASGLIHQSECFDQCTVGHYWSATLVPSKESPEYPDHKAYSFLFGSTENLDNPIYFESRERDVYSGLAVRPVISPEKVTKKGFAPSNYRSCTLNVIADTVVSDTDPDFLEYAREYCECNTPYDLEEFEAKGEFYEEVIQEASVGWWEGWCLVDVDDDYPDGRPVIRAIHAERELYNRLFANMPEVALCLEPQIARVAVEKCGFPFHTDEAKFAKLRNTLHKRFNEMVAEAKAEKAKNNTNK